MTSSLVGVRLMKTKAISVAALASLLVVMLSGCQASAESRVDAKLRYSIKVARTNVGTALTGATPAEAVARIQADERGTLLMSQWESTEESPSQFSAPSASVFGYVANGDSLYVDVVVYDNLITGGGWTYKNDRYFSCVRFTAKSSKSIATTDTPCPDFVKKFVTPDMTQRTLADIGI